MIFTKSIHVINISFVYKIIKCIVYNNYIKYIIKKIVNINENYHF